MELQPCVTFQLPKDQTVLAAIGTVTIRATDLDYMLRMTVASIAGITEQEALDATARQRSHELRVRVRKLAKRRFGESNTLLLLDALLTRARKASERRNELIHNLWAQELDGDLLVRDDNRKWSPAPSAANLEALTEEFAAITLDIVKARQEGFLFAALAKPSPSGRLP